MSVTTSARSVPRATARVWWTIASSVTVSVCWWPSMTDAERIADEDDVDAGAIEQAGHRRVVRRQHGDLLARLFLLTELRNANAAAAHRVPLTAPSVLIAANVFVSHAVSAPLTSLLTLRSVSEAYSVTSPVKAGISR